VVRVQDGMLLLFPAYLRHSVDANASQDDRISISFNIMFSAFTETLTRPLWSPPDRSRRAGGSGE
jgi:ectoine hydroxylase-related dioxygenase (phytanoyl-CoA dioxygenase family)